MKNEIENKNKFPWWSLLVIPILIGEFLFYDHDYLISDLFDLFLIVFLLGYIHLTFKKTYKNIGMFVILLFSLLVIFPLIQIILYSSNDKHFVYNQEFLNYKKEIIQHEIENFESIDLVDSILISNHDNYLNCWISNDLINDTIIINGISVLIEKNHNINRPTDRNGGGYIQKTITLLSNTNKNNLLISIYNEPLKSGLLRMKNEYFHLKKIEQNPRLDIRRKDIWIDSISGFLLGNIKPISSISQIIQLFQILNLFILGIIMSQIILNSNYLIIKKGT